MRKKRTLGVLFCLLIPVFATSCARMQDVAEQTKNRDISPDLVYDHSMQLDFAHEFAIDFYKEGYTLVTISGEQQFLVIPEEAPVPEKIGSDIVVLKQPITNIYLVASAVMDMFCSMDALDNIRLSGIREEAWHIEKAKAAMGNGSILYAGKYNAPDYELILSQHCGLSVQSTMITHSPEVKEKLEGFGIPVLVDCSSYEEHPLGRTEWIKLYGVLTGKQAEAEKAFLKQKEAFSAVANGKDAEKVEKKEVAFFYITSNETVNVRKPGDYIPKMIELAGGTYIFQDLGGEGSASATVHMQLEEFYAKAKDADYIIYNSTVDGEVSSIRELLAKSALLKDFKAVKNGDVWCTTQNLYQESMKLGTMIEDIHNMLRMEEPPDGKLTYLFRLE